MYALVPLEGSLYLIKADDSMALSPEELHEIDSRIKSGESLEDMQDYFDNIWLP